MKENNSKRPNGDAQWARRVEIGRKNPKDWVKKLGQKSHPGREQKGDANVSKKNSMPSVGGHKKVYHGRPLPKNSHNLKKASAE